MGNQLRKLGRAIKRKEKPERGYVVCGKCGKCIDETLEAVAWDSSGDICEECFEDLYMVQSDKAEM